MSDNLKQVFIGNFLLIGCCIFYLAWWILAFRPNHPIKGMKSGWLLIPAFLLGIAAVFLICMHLSTPENSQQLFPNGLILWTGIAFYILLSFISARLLGRPVTTELILIIGWTMLALSELNAFYACSLMTHSFALILSAVTVILSAVCLYCYMKYYHLDVSAGFIDGMIPLILAAVMTAVLNLILII